MSSSTENLFLPGWGAKGALYERGVPASWHVLDPPGFRANRGSFAMVRRWLIEELDRRSGPVVLAGHSMGGALAIAAAAARPEQVQGLLLISPAGLPLSKPIRKSLHDFVGQAVRGRYPREATLSALGALLRAPVSALQLARSIRSADLTREMGHVRRASIESMVVGCTTDTLVTPQHCRHAAGLLGARYEELSLTEGHMWMLERWQVLSALLTFAAH